MCSGYGCLGALQISETHQPNLAIAGRSTTAILVALPALLLRVSRAIFSRQFCLWSGNSPVTVDRHIDIKSTKSDFVYGFHPFATPKILLKTGVDCPVRGF